MAHNNEAGYFEQLPAPCRSVQDFVGSIDVAEDQLRRSNQRLQGVTSVKRGGDDLTISREHGRKEYQRTAMPGLGGDRREESAVAFADDHGRGSVPMSNDHPHLTDRSWHAGVGPADFTQDALNDGVA